MSNVQYPANFTVLKGLTIWLSLIRAKSNEFALLPGHVLYREPGGHKIGGQKVIYSAEAIHR